MRILTLLVFGFWLGIIARFDMEEAGLFGILIAVIGFIASLVVLFRIGVAGLIGVFG